MWDSTYRISTALMPSNGNIRISNRKQSYNLNTVPVTVTWHNNTCNMNGDPYDKRNHTCMYHSDMPRIYVTMITIIWRAVVRAVVYPCTSGAYTCSNNPCNISVIVHILTVISVYYNTMSRDLTVLVSWWYQCMQYRCPAFIFSDSVVSSTTVDQYTCDTSYLTVI